MWAYKCADFLVKHQNENNEKRRVYYYGFQVILGELLKLIILILASLLLGTLQATIMATIAFVFLRTTAGGTHMDTYGKCMVVTLVIFLFTGVFAQYTYQYWSDIQILILVIGTFVGGLFIIIKWAPGDTPNKPIKDPKKIRNFKRKSIIMISLWLILMLIMKQYSNNVIIISACMGVLFESFTITPAGYSFFTWISGVSKKH
jgi:accessory gene regulator B